MVFECVFQRSWRATKKLTRKFNNDPLDLNFFYTKGLIISSKPIPLYIYTSIKKKLKSNESLLYFLVNYWNQIDWAKFHKNQNYFCSDNIIYIIIISFYYSFVLKLYILNWNISVMLYFLISMWVLNLEYTKWYWQIYYYSIDIALYMGNVKYQDSRGINWSLVTFI